MSPPQWHLRPVSTLPGGIVTFLFTDVEGSTRLATALGDAGWAALLKIAAIRRLLGEHSLVTLTGIGGSGKTRLPTEGPDRCGELDRDGGAVRL